MAARKSRLARTRGADLQNQHGERIYPSQIRKRGRPALHPDDEDVLYLARWAARRGAGYHELADLLKISKPTFDEWMLTNDAFSAAVHAGELEQFDARVERTLAERAMGYFIDVEKVFKHEGGVVRTTVREYVPPDTGAMTMWLKNRMPARWRDQQDVKFTADSTVPDNRREAMAILNMLQLGLLQVGDGGAPVIEHEKAESDDVDPDE